MKLDFGPRGALIIDDATITYQNFSGRETQYNREGNRNFAVIIDERYYDELIRLGWNVKTRINKETGELIFYYLPVKVQFNGNTLDPNVYLVSLGKQNKLEEENVGILDKIAISNVNMDIRRRDWNINGKTGVTAYLSGMQVFQEVDRFAAEYFQDGTTVESEDYDDDPLPF